MTKRCNQTWYMTGVTWLAASVSLSVISDHHVNRLESERLGSGSRPWFPPSGWHGRLLKAILISMTSPHKSLSFYRPAPYLSTTLRSSHWSPSIGWWTNKKANHGTNGNGWKVFPINRRWGAGVGTSDQSERENTVDTTETCFLVSVFWKKLICLEVVHCPPVLWILLLKLSSVWARAAGGWFIALLTNIHAGGWSSD